MHHSIEIERLSFSYPDGHPALKDVSLAIQPCEKVALVGHFPFVPELRRAAYDTLRQLKPGDGARHCAGVRLAGRQR